MANNEVLENLHRAYLAAEDEQVRNGIIKAWAEETNEILAYQFMYDPKIRAWQPEQPDPLAELTRRVEEVSIEAKAELDQHKDEYVEFHKQTVSVIEALTKRVDGHDEQYGELEERIRLLESNVSLFVPPCTPDDQPAEPICKHCGKTRAGHFTHALWCNEIRGTWETCFTPSPQPAPEPDDPVCARCNHVRSEHHRGSHSVCSWATCSCDEFESEDDLPAPPAAPLDPVLVKIKDLYVALDGTKVTGLAPYLRDAWALLTGVETHSTDANMAVVIQSAIRAYGVPS